jgi:glycosyltransferase involved in cell wall biosynthesis
MHNPTVDVLLATYNGERYLRAQVDSLLAQSCGSFRILARDDGSTDRTTEILQEYERNCPERFIVIDDGPPTGSAKYNFGILLRHSTASYIAFCDQDDFWFPHKLERTLHRLLSVEAQRGAAVPALVFTNLWLADGDLKSAGITFWEEQIIKPEYCRSLARLLRQNVVTGCTMMINRALAGLVRSIPSSVYMHDWWFALIASTLGSIDYIDEPMMLYRVHGNNACGLRVPNRGLPRLGYHSHRAHEWRSIMEQTNALNAVFRDRLRPEHRRVIDALREVDASSSPVRRVYNVLRHGVFHAELRRTIANLWHLSVGMEHERIIHGKRARVDEHVERQHRAG